MERLDERARSLAARFTLAPSRHAARSVFPRFDDNVGVLRKAYRVLADDVHRGEFVTSAAEWLLDNFHLVTSEIGDVRQNLPRGYYRELPKLAAREQAGNARVYAIAVELIRHSDSRLDRAQLVRWLDAFQTVAPLTIGELWAWPSMLKLALVENLRRLAQETLVARAARRAADAYVARIDAGGRGVPSPLPRALHPALVVQLLQHVREYGPRLAAVRSALDAHLASEHATAEEAVRGEHQREAAAQVSVANVIGSLRLCSTLDWTQYVETVSLVERVLQRDPAGVYGRMEFLSRDRYRQVVEELAEPTGEGQVRVALRAMESAREQNLFQSTQIATVFLDRSFRIQRFTPEAMTVFRLADGDVGRPLSDFAAGSKPRGWGARSSGCCIRSSPSSARSGRATAVASSSCG